MNNKLREESKELRKKLRASQNDSDRLPEVEADLKETRNRLENLEKNQPDEMVQDQLKLELDKVVKEKIQISNELASTHQQLQEEKKKLKDSISSRKKRKKNSKFNSMSRFLKKKNQKKE